MLRDGGYLTQQFTDGQEFLDGIHPDLDAAVLGIMMPRVNGIEVLHWLRRNRPGLPVVTMSSLSKYANGDELLALGFKAHFPLPFSPQALVQAISRLFE